MMLKNIYHYYSKMKSGVKKHKHFISPDIKWCVLLLTILEDNKGVRLKAAFSLGQTQRCVGQQVVFGSTVTSTRHI